MSVETKPNKLVKGLVLDTFHTDVDNTVATYALNSQLEDQEGNHFHYGSEVGTTYIKNIPDTHVVVGHINMERNETVLFTTDGTNSTIGILSRNDDMSYQYEIKVDDTKQTKKLGFKKNIYIRGVYRLLNGCDKVIYFVDGVNKDRRINLNQLDSYKLPTTVTSGIIFDNNISAIIYNISTLTGDIKIIRVLSPTNLFTQSNVVANLIRAVNFQSNLFTSSSLVGDINFVQKVSSNISSNSLLVSNINFVQKVASNLNTSSSLISNLQLAKNMESSITASSLLNSDLKISKTFESSLNANGTLISDLKIAKNADANLSALASLTGDINFVQKAQANLSALASLSGDINFVQKAQASLLTSASVTGNLTIPKTFNASLLATGTTTADLTVQAAASLLLDLYPNAAAAYSLRKLRTAYTGSAVRVRASTSGAEGDVSFDVNSTISASSTVTVTAVGTSGLSIGQQVTFSTFWNAGGSNQNVFVTTWYDQSGNARNATQTTQASQPQIVSSGAIILQGSKPIITFTNNIIRLNTPSFSISANRTYLMTLYSQISTAGSYKVYLGALAGGASDFINGIFGLNGTSNIVKSYVGSGVSNDSVGVNAMTNNTYYLHGAYIQGSVQHQHYRNGVLNAQNTSLTISPITTPQANVILFTNVSGNDLRTNEAIIWDSYQSTNRVGIETNINNYYAIY